ncbi:Uncharacterised protein [Yersinia intermedia]|jgi:hypothetical protein|nr:Uncharacterised protein [Yersinia intermedia]CNF77181.1 Uncharacterised protein [Yersinia intermedia]
MESFREQLRTGVLTVATTTSKIKSKIQKKGFNANFTIDSSGYCDFPIPEDNYFLLKCSRNDFKRVNNVDR